MKSYLIIPRPALTSAKQMVFERNERTRETELVALTSRNSHSLRVATATFKSLQKHFGKAPGLFKMCNIKKIVGVV